MCSLAVLSSGPSNSPAAGSRQLIRLHSSHFAEAMLHAEVEQRWMTFSQPFYLTFSIELSLSLSANSVLTTKYSLNLVAIVSSSFSLMKVLVRVHYLLGRLIMITRELLQLKPNMSTGKDWYHFSSKEEFVKLHISLAYYWFWRAHRASSDTSKNRAT